jgi:hypothetical protein
MKLPRFRLGTVIKVVVAINLAAAMVWGNVRWNVESRRTRMHKGRLQDVIEACRGWPVIFSRGGGWAHTSEPQTLHLVAGFKHSRLSLNIAACAAILFGAVLVLFVAPRIFRRRPSGEPKVRGRIAQDADRTP